MPSPTFRFAPSPNGHLHLGHAYSALFTDYWARQLGGTFLLRLEDIDPTRCRPEFAESIYDDLRWLGLDWPEPVMVQSARLKDYQSAAAHLRKLGLLYPCFCSRSEIAAHAIGTDPDGSPLYGGTCRRLTSSEADARVAHGEPAAYRLDSNRAIALAGQVSFSAAAPSPADRPMIRFARPQLWGDVVIQRKDTPTSYHLSVVVDDAAQAITHVTRGVDMEPSTDIHVLLQMLLGLPQPLYTFHRLILDGDGKKLSKSRDSKSLRDLRATGWTPADVRKAVGLG